MSMIVSYIQRNLEFNIGTKVDGTFNVRSAEEVRKKGEEKKEKNLNFLHFFLSSLKKVMCIRALRPDFLKEKTQASSSIP